MSTSFTFKLKDDPANTLNLFDDILKEVKADLAITKEELNQLGSDTASKMIEFIQQNKVRPQNGEPQDLESHINTEFFEDGWGVGDIDLLNDNAPYWAAVNWGSDHMVGKRVPAGFFEPGNPIPDPSSFRQGRWNVDTLGGGLSGGGLGQGRKHYSFIVLNAIPAMNYI